MTKTFSTLALSLALGTAGLVHAAGTTSPAIYPAKGQSAKQQDKDKYQCYGWAREQTGFDPAQPQTAAAPAHQPPGALARGAMSGAAIAAISDHAPARGAAAGGRGAARRGQPKEPPAAQPQQAAQAQQKSAYDRAFRACMEGRGYVLR